MTHFNLPLRLRYNWIGKSRAFSLRSAQMVKLDWLQGKLVYNNSSADSRWTMSDNMLSDSLIIVSNSRCPIECRIRLPQDRRTYAFVVYNERSCVGCIEWYITQLELRKPCQCWCHVIDFRCIDPNNCLLFVFDNQKMRQATIMDNTNMIYSKISLTRKQLTVTAN